MGFSNPLANQHERANAPNEESPIQPSILSKEQLFSRLRSIPVWVWLIFFNLVVYTFTAILSGNYLTINDEIIRIFGISGTTIAIGWVWQFVTAMFSHLNLLHLTTNMLFLIAFGMLFEERIGRRNFYLIYFFSGFAGNITSIVIFPQLVSIGASAAIFGIVGVTIVRQIKSVVFGALFVILLSGILTPTALFAHGIGATTGVIIDRILIWITSRTS